MEQPNLSTLPNRMRYAATVLKEATDVMGNTAGNSWTPWMLSKWAEHYEALEELAEDIGKVVYLFGEGDPRMREMWRDQARTLIGWGWRKEALS